MADQASSTITINAPLDDVLAVIADLDSYPQWTRQIKSAEVLETGDDGRAKRVRFVIDAGSVKDDYVLDYTWEGDRSVSWTLVSSQLMKRQDGSYTLTGADGRTAVTYAITIDTKIPLLGMMKRKAEKVILDTALKELKKRVEG